ncbi:carotenoid oxygenase family protein [Coleofasciculus sp. F4-SAH-05]|uniref:carotenoid oxygenase family protein n=1 Tax=Coleofasciculus sp. F4-SAH-05 TaxID=3069525 RepID=UPI0032F4AAA5
MITTEKESELSFDREGWKGWYESQPNEYDYWIENIEGEVPPELKGTLFRNGPGLFDINGQRLHHPFDGDGMVCAIAFDQGRVHFRNRFVRTEGYLKEKKAVKILYRGVFGTQKPGGLWANIFDIKLKNIANTHVVYWGGKLLAMWDAAEHYQLDPKTLETLGKDDPDGIWAKGHFSKTHSRIDLSCDQDGGVPCLVSFTIKLGLLNSKITIHEQAPDGKLRRSYSHTVPGFTLPPGQLFRFTLNLADATVQQQRLSERCCEFPCVHPNHVGRPYRYVYMGVAHNPTGNAPLQAIAKFDVTTGEEQVWSAAPQGFVSEPIFVPHPDAKREDEGWVLTLVYDSSHHRSDVVILDGRDLSHGAIARLHLKHHIPYGLHGSWTSTVF